MRYGILLAAVTGSVLASNAGAAFTFATTRTNLANGTQDRVSLLVGSTTPTISIAVFSVDITAVGNAHGLKFFVPAVGNLQGDPNDNTTSQPFNEPSAGPPEIEAPAILPAAAVVTFGKIVSNGTPFSTTVTVTHLDGGLLTLAAGFPTTIGGTSSTAGLIISPAGGAAGTSVTFTVAGTVIYGGNGTITIPLTATDSNGLTGTGPLVLTLVPEPTSLFALAGAAGFGVIRRRK